MLQVSALTKKFSRNKTAAQMWSLLNSELDIAALFRSLSPLWVRDSGSALAGAERFWEAGLAGAVPTFGLAEQTGTAVRTVTSAANQGGRCWKTELEFTGGADPNLGRACEWEDHRSGNAGGLV